MAMPDRGGRGPIQPTLFPNFQPSEKAAFQIATVPSGGISAVAKLNIELNNSPQILYGIRWAVSYELPAEFWALNPNYKALMREGGVDFDFDVEVNLTQQNITQARVPFEAFTGRGNVNHTPLPVPYAFQGGNNLAITCTRNSSYPLPDGLDIVAPMVTAVAVLGLAVSDTGGSAWAPAP